MAHTISEEWQPKKFVLAMKYFPGKHDAESILGHITDILTEWEIKLEQCFSFTTDSASNMLKAFGHTFNHFSCGAHQLNLIVKGGLMESNEEIKEALQKSRAIVGHFKHSNQAAEHLKSIQTNLKKPEHKLIQVILFFILISYIYI